MLNKDIMKEFLFDCRMRKLSERTIKGYKNNNLAMLHFIMVGKTRAVRCYKLKI